MTESEKLVWFEADGTRHVFDEAPSKTTDVADEPAAESVEEPSADEPFEKPAAVEPTVTEPVEKPSADEPTVTEPVEEPSALRGMLRALALGAAAAAATGAAVGAISLAATGDRPDTTGGTVPSTTIALEEPGDSGTSEVERVELDPPTTSADQPG
jgi:CTP:molybdopterin cytidylyltransferase MocA